MVCAAQAADHGELQFSGRIVNEGCAVERLGIDNHSGRFQPLRLSPNLTVAVGTTASACDEEPLPFTASFKPKVEIGDTAIEELNSGIVTQRYF